MLDFTKLPDASWTTPKSTKTSVTNPAGATQTTESSGMWEPEQWGQAGDYYNQLMSGQYTNPALQGQAQMSQTGNPSDINAWAAAYKPAMMDQYSNMVRQMAEQAGVGGARYGSGLQQSIGQYGGQLQNQFNSDIAGQWLQAQEAAKQRMMQSQQYLGGLGSQGAEGAMGLGTQRANLPLAVSAAMGNVGQQQTAQQVNPYMSLMASMLGSPYATPQTYQPSVGTSMMGISPYLLQLFQSGGGGSSPGDYGLSAWPGAGQMYGGG